MAMSLEQVGNHLLVTIMGEAPLDEITSRTKAFMATLEDDAVLMVHRFARKLLAARADEPPDMDRSFDDPEDILRQDLMLAGIGAVSTFAEPPACEHICGDHIYELTPKAWEEIKASRANPDAAIDYGMMLDLEIMAHCPGQTADEADEITVQIENRYDHPRAAVADIRSGGIRFEKINGRWFALLPITPPTKALLEIREEMASLESEGKLFETGQMRWSARSGEFVPVYRLKGR
jgi:hypothetical protein